MFTNDGAEFADLVNRHGVPAAVLAVYEHGELFETASGTADMAGGKQVSTETRFLIGSITKLFTATLVMQAIDRDVVDLNAPASTYVPELRTPERVAVGSISVRQLLSHTGGIDSDFYANFPPEDGIRRYVDACADLALLHPPGLMYSYSNLGYVILGRLLEVATTSPWHKLVQAQLLRPLGMHKTTVDLQQPPQDVAVGYVDSCHGPYRRPFSDQMFPSCMAPCGTTAAATTGDLVAFARLHLENGAAPNGASILSPFAAQAMQHREAIVPGGQFGAHGTGLGWHLYSWGGLRVIGHDGVNMGHFTYLRIVPERRFAVVLLSNSVRGRALWIDVVCGLAKARLGVTVTASQPRASEEPSVDVSRYRGRYVRHGLEFNVDSEGELLTLRTLFANAYLREAMMFFCGSTDSIPFVLRYLDADLFLAEGRCLSSPMPVTFLGSNGGHAQYLHMLGRACRRSNGP